MFENTNLENKGLTSAARDNKITRLLTIPRPLFKSSAKDLSSAIFEIVIQELPQRWFATLRSDSQCMVPDSEESIFTQVVICGRHTTSLSSTGSSLEAFSFYPTHVASPH